MEIDLINKIIKQIKNKTTLNSLFFALFIASNFIANVFGALDFMRNRFLPIFYIILFFFSLSVNLKQWNVFPKKSIYIFFSFLIFFLFSFFFHGTNEIFLNYFFNFIVLSVLSIQLLKSKMSVNKIMVSSVLILLLLLYPTFQTVFYWQMGVSFWLPFSYNILFLLLANGYVILNKKNNLWLRIVSCFLLLIYGVNFLEDATRGAFLVIVGFLVLLVIFIKIRTAKIMIYFISGIAIITTFITFNFIRIITVAHNILSSLNINVTALERMIHMERYGIDMTSARGELIDFAMEGIRGNFLFGNGVGAYEMRVGLWVHNIFLQFLYELGIIYLLFLLFILCYFIRLLISTPNSSEKVFLIMIFSVGFLPQLISLPYQLIPRFWIAMYGIFIYQTKEEEMLIVSKKSFLNGFNSFKRIIINLSKLKIGKLDYK